VTVQQIALFTEPGVRHDDGFAARTAAEKVRPSHQSRLERIAAIVDSSGYYGCTADEVHQRVVLEDVKAVRSTWHGATAAAAKEGLIVPRGYKHVRLSVNDSPMTIYVTPRWMK
jgi:hypothetical protein